jgi:hypothetical protein
MGISQSTPPPWAALHPAPPSPSRTKPRRSAATFTSGPGVLEFDDQGGHDDVPNRQFAGTRRDGTNHVSMNLGSFDRVAGPQRGTNYPIYTDALLDWYQVKNIRSLRLISPGGQLPSDTNT